MFDDDFMYLQKSYKGHIHFDITEIEPSQSELFMIFLKTFNMRQKLMKSINKRIPENKSIIAAWILSFSSVSSDDKSDAKHQTNVSQHVKIIYPQEIMDKPDSFMLMNLYLVRKLKDFIASAASSDYVFDSFERIDIDAYALYPLIGSGSYIKTPSCFEDKHYIINPMNTDNV